RHVSPFPTRRSSDLARSRPTDPARNRKIQIQASQSPNSVYRVETAPRGRSVVTDTKDALLVRASARTRPCGSLTVSAPVHRIWRSEEHTSELQSPDH